MNNNKQPHPHRELIKAWADGEEIQVFLNGSWEDCMEPLWRSDGKYRIKPEEQKNAPKCNDGYFYVDDGGFVQCAIWNDSNQDFFRLNVGNVYYAQSVANGAAERVKAALKGEEPEELKKLREENEELKLRLKQAQECSSLSDGETALILALRKTWVISTWESDGAVLVYEESGDLVSRKDFVAFFADANNDEIRAALNAISREQEQEANND